MGQLVQKRQQFVHDPTCFMSLCNTTSSMEYRFESSECDFFREGTGEQYEFHLINCNVEGYPIIGGLGTCELKPLNHTFLGE